MNVFRKAYVRAIAASFAFMTIQSPLLAAQVGGVVPLNCATIFTIPTQHDVGYAGAASLTFNGSSVTNITISMVYPFKTCYSTGTPPIEVCYSVTPAPQNWIVYLNSDGTAEVVSPTFTVAGQTTGYTTSTGTYTGGVTVNGYVGYNIATTLTLTSGALSGKSCGLTGSTFYVGS